MVNWIELFTFLEGVPAPDVPEKEFLAMLRQIQYGCIRAQPRISFANMVNLCEMWSFDAATAQNAPDIVCFLEHDLFFSPQDADSMGTLLRDVLQARGAGFVACMLPIWHTRDHDEDIALLRRFFALYEKETAVSYFLQRQAASTDEVTIEAFEMVLKTKMPKDVWTRHDEFTSEELIHVAILVMDFASQRVSLEQLKQISGQVEHWISDNVLAESVPN